MKHEYDFSGYATRANLKCSDGRIILKDAFKHNDGNKVPLVWNHCHEKPEEVLGHAYLENREDGVYAYCKFNESESGKAAKMLVEHGDVNQLSIYANQLKQQGSNVIHGNIRELSLVLAGANPGAYIDTVIKHSDSSDEEAIIYGYADDNIELHHADDSSSNDTEETIGDVFSTLSEKQKKVVYALIGMISEGEIEHSDDYEPLQHNSSEETIGDVFSTLSEKQKKAVYAMIGMILDEKNNNQTTGGNSMKHNVFDNSQQNQNGRDTLSHSEMKTIIDDGKRYGTLSESFLAHAEEYGIDNVEYLFPDMKNVTNKPIFISRDMTWVQKVMGSVGRSPFSRIKSLFADITEDDARAKGYIKGKLKKEEVFSLLKRTTQPTTVYKKQKMDRDDVIDIVDFDVITWLKAEMRLMLDEELARAILIGDGRLASSDDKINEQSIRPVFNDEDLFTIKKTVDVVSEATPDAIAKEFIRSVIKSRKDYKGSGSPTLYTTEDMVTDMLLLEDKMGRVIYDSVEKLKTVLRVKDIVTVPVMEGLKDKNSKPVLGVIVNLADYKVGADKGGSVNMFEDFDIDYNQQKYLIETRCSGALVTPYSAITLTLNEGAF